MSVESTITTAAKNVLQSGSNSGSVLITHQKSWRTFWMDLTLAAIPIGFGIYMIRKLRHITNPGGESKKGQQAEDSLRVAFRNSGRKGPFPELDEHEKRIVADIVFPAEITTTFEDVGGLASVKENLLESVILPLQNPELFSQGTSSAASAGKSLLTAPRGVLMYGPPGTGKSLVAKAIAKDCQATFINLKLSTIMDKWLGESQKLVRSLFSVARKFAPSIIFIDEVDLFLRQRASSDHEATAQIKSEFMTLWDGLTTDDTAQVTVLGATNRPFDVDKAILRRMPRAFLFDLPDEKERLSILTVILKGHRVADDLKLSELAARTQGYSGSDLKELCKHAALTPVREVIRRHREKTAGSKNHHVAEKPRPLGMQDFLDSMNHVRPSGEASVQYLRDFDPLTGGTRKGAGAGAGAGAGSGGLGLGGTGDSSGSGGSAGAAGAPRTPSYSRAPSTPLGRPSSMEAAAAMAALQRLAEEVARNGGMPIPPLSEDALRSPTAKRTQSATGGAGAGAGAGASAAKPPAKPIADARAAMGNGDESKSDGTSSPPG